MPLRGLIADRAYDSDGLIAWLEQRGVEVVIPPRSTSPQRQVSWLLYRLRNVVERAFCRLKQFRRVATQLTIKRPRVPAPSSTAPPQPSGSECQRALAWRSRR